MNVVHTYSQVIITTVSVASVITGDMFKSQRRFTLHTLRDLGFGKAAIEARVKEQASQLEDSLRSRDPGEPVDPTDPIQACKNSV